MTRTLNAIYNDEDFLFLKTALWSINILTTINIIFSGINKLLFATLIYDARLYASPLNERLNYNFWPCTSRSFLQQSLMSDDVFFVLVDI